MVRRQAHNVQGRQFALTAYVWSARLLLGAIMLFAALAKIRSPFFFLSRIYDYELVGPNTGLAIAIFVPALEVVVALCLIFGLLLRGALACASLLGAAFSLATFSAVQQKLDISCGCFSGASTGKVGYDVVARSLAIFLLAISSWWAIITLHKMACKEVQLSCKGATRFA